MDELKESAQAIFGAGLAAADPYALLREGFRDEPGAGFGYGDAGGLLPPPAEGGRVRIFGAGKAACSLALALVERLGPRELSGRVVVKYGHGIDVPGVAVEEGGHPLPDEAGLAATERLLSDLADTREADRIFFALTGGASALLVKPAPGIALADKIATTELLLRGGATISELNAVRKHLSDVKGGRLLERIVPASVMALVVSDVIGDDLSSIGSGPLVEDPTTFSDALAIVEKYGLARKLPPPVWRRLREGAKGRVGETLKKGDPLLECARHVILASNRSSLAAARDEAIELGFHAEVFRWDMEGNVHAVAEEFVRRLLAPEAPRPFALLAGGELTLQVRGNGRGGRNQEFALVAARLLAGRRGVLVLSAGTDGTDGPTDAAGAFATGESWERARKEGIDPEAALLDNDSYRVFERLSDLLETGPTGTNVNDLVVGLSK
jgi:glycerate-2-kinase